mgnify:CR=1 FL=1
MNFCKDSKKKNQTWLFKIINFRRNCDSSADYSFLRACNIKP